MKEVKGNLIDIAEAGGFDVIVQGCNCFSTMRSGLAGEIARRCPEAVWVDRMDQRIPVQRLGGSTQTTIRGANGPYVIINAYTQFNYGRDPNVRYADYDAIKRVFRSIARDYCKKRIGIPKIGAGLANGDWSVIKQIIDEALIGMDYTYVYLE